MLSLPFCCPGANRRPRIPFFVAAGHRALFISLSSFCWLHFSRHLVSRSPLLSFSLALSLPLLLSVSMYASCDSRRLAFIDRFLKSKFLLSKRRLTCSRFLNLRDRNRKFLSHRNKNRCSLSLSLRLTMGCLLELYFSHDEVIPVALSRHRDGEPVTFSFHSLDWLYILGLGRPSWYAGKSIGTHATAIENGPKNFREATIRHDSVFIFVWHFSSTSVDFYNVIAGKIVRMLRVLSLICFHFACFSSDCRIVATLPRSNTCRHNLRYRTFVSHAWNTFSRN